MDWSQKGRGFGDLGILNVIKENQMKVKAQCKWKDDIAQELDFFGRRNLIPNKEQVSDWIVLLC